LGCINDGEQKAKKCHTRFVDEGRKRVLLLAASILAARKLAQVGEARSPAFESVIANAIATAERILTKIDSRWPTRTPR
jgi:hypothetical protein